MLKDLARVFDRLIRWVFVLGTASYGAILLSYAADTDSPAKVVFFFATSVAFFGSSYWWMYDAKVNDE